MSEALTASLLAGVRLPLVLVARDERIRHLNPPAADLFGKDMVGRHFLTVLRQPGVTEAIAATLRTDVPQEARFTRRDHMQETLYRVQCTPVRDPSMGGVLASFDDVTSVETAGQMRRDFVANVSHELRTPLTAILGFIETLRGPARDDAEARDRFLATMSAEAERMNRLVTDLLSLSRVETEERVRPTELLDLPELVGGVCLSLGPIAENAGVRIDCAAAPSGLPLVQGDKDQMRQVFANLIENALKYASAGERIAIGFDRISRDPVLGQAAVVAWVEDFGPGIDSIHIHRLTERFYRADDHRAAGTGGTGLGLAIVKHILNRHRGRLKIESTVGRGSRFSVLLPIPGN